MDRYAARFLAVVVSWLVLEEALQAGCLSGRGHGRLGKAAAAGSREPVYPVWIALLSAVVPMARSVRRLPRRSSPAYNQPEVR